MMSFVRAILVLLYSIVTTLLKPLLKIARRVKPELAAQLAGRPTARDLTTKLAKPRAAKRRAVLFFCSSAGEFEQARPLIARFAAQQDVFLHVLFFSKSGYEFALARGETVSFSLSPAVDSVWEWGSVFAAVRPDIVVVVRHELWPGFLETARHYAKVYLIDASQSLGEARSRWKRIARGQLLQYFDAIFVVSDDDREFFATTYGIDRSRLVVSGDTKYDRVLERARAKTADVERLRTLLGGPRKRLVIGSAHRPDVETWLKALAIAGASVNDWQTVIVPHHVDGSTLAFIQTRCRDQGLECAYLSALESGSQTAPAVVIVDKMGQLAEIYGTATLAFVGGALHHQVHNVLEPACHGLGLAFGPMYANSPEAVHLVQQNLAKVIDTPEAMAAWWQGQRPDSAKLLSAVDGLCGAADRIMAQWGWAKTAAHLG